MPKIGLELTFLRLWKEIILKTEGGEVSSMFSDLKLINKGCWLPWKALIEKNIKNKKMIDIDWSPCIWFSKSFIRVASGMSSSWNWNSHIVNEIRLLTHVTDFQTCDKRDLCPYKTLMSIWLAWMVFIFLLEAERRSLIADIYDSIHQSEYVDFSNEVLIEHLLQGMKTFCSSWDRNITLISEVRDIP